jgi:hypothetical protein
MKTRILTILLSAAAALLSSALHAAPAAVVEAVQFPAWLDRGGHSVPLTPGTVLRAEDRLRTGENARVQVKLAEGSTVKLGEKARFEIVRIEEKGVFKAALNVLTGAFRFTTDALKKKRQRDVSVQVKNVTVGIRGTDLWGKSNDERDLVCLLEGKISVGAAGHPQVTLDQPLDFYQKPRDGDPKVAKVDPKQIEEWAKETEIAKDGAAARAGGGYRVVAAKFARRDEALTLNRELRAAGYPAEVVTAEQGFAVQVSGLAGEGEARALASGISNVKGVSSPAVHQGRR